MLLPKNTSLVPIFLTTRLQFNNVLYSTLKDICILKLNLLKTLKIIRLYLEIKILIMRIDHWILIVKGPSLRKGGHLEESSASGGEDVLCLPAYGRDDPNSQKVCSQTPQPKKRDLGKNAGFCMGIFCWKKNHTFRPGTDIDPKIMH